MSDLVKDLRYGARPLADRPGCAVAAVLCTALGVRALRVGKIDPIVAPRVE